MLSRWRNWIDSHQTESVMYAFLGGLTLVGCCCGTCLTYVFTWLFQ
jgi:hypothetical protein